jgi:alpha-glucosidase
MDDGRSFAYKHGDFLRMEFTCSEKPNGITLHIGPHQGSYIPWWKSLQIEVYGANSSSLKASIVGSTETVESSFDALRHVITLLLPDNARGRDVQVEWNP